MRRNASSIGEWFPCPSCGTPLPCHGLPDECVECGLTIEIFSMSEEACDSVTELQGEPDVILAPTQYVVNVGWVVAHTRLLLA